VNAQQRLAHVERIACYTVGIAVNDNTCVEKNAMEISDAMARRGMKGLAVVFLLCEMAAFSSTSLAATSYANASPAYNCYTCPACDRYNRLATQSDIVVLILVAARVSSIEE
jgi:hypothetical protein